MRTRTIALSMLLLALAVSPGCAPAEAKPLEVSYYYLPG